MLAGGARGRRGRDPVRRRHQHLRQPRGARGRGPAGASRSTSAAWTGCSTIDAASRLARVQAGVFGPQLEEQLNAARLDARPLPRQLRALDARRLDRDALVGDAVRQVRRHRRPHARAARGDAGGDARASARCRARRPGPSVREMVLGSEGRLGIITEATVHVHRVPERAGRSSATLPDWAGALAAMREIAASEAAPSVTRVSDACETAFSFATRKAPLAAGPRQVERAAGPTYAAARLRPRAMCLVVHRLRGQRRATSRRSGGWSGGIVSATAALCIGSGPGELYDQKKFDTPYIRDYLLDRGALGDVSETAAPWSALRGSTTTSTRRRARRRSPDRASAATSCATSRTPTTRARACTSRSRSSPSGTRDALDEYDVVKGAIQQAFVDAGGDALAPPRGRDRACPLARAGHLGGRRGDAAGAVRGDGPRREPQPGEDHGRRRACASPESGHRVSGPRPRRQSDDAGPLHARRAVLGRHQPARPAGGGGVLRRPVRLGAGGPDAAGVRRRTTSPPASGARRPPP